jgi:hypothetical protein
MARMPEATWLGEQSPRIPMERYDIVCIHTIVGFAPAHAAHFSTETRGKILQSRDTKFRSGANLDGNHRVIAIENEDAALDVPLSGDQVEACAKILAWAHKVHGVPLQLCPDSRPGSRGLAYHRQGCDGNFGGPGVRFPGRVSGGEKWSTSFGKICPRDKRIAQLPAILKRAKELVSGDDMTPEDFQKISAEMRKVVKEELAIERPKSAAAVWLHQLTNRVTKGKIGTGAVLEYMHEDVHGLSTAEVEPDPKA